MVETRVEEAEIVESVSNNRKSKKSFLLGVWAGVLLSILVLYVATSLKLITFRTNFSLVANSSSANSPAETTKSDIDQAEITKVVLPDKVNLGVTFGDSIVKMVKMGAIDKNKFTKLYEGRNPLTDDQKKLLTDATSDEMVITASNANLILNLLWPLGIANKSKTLVEGPMGTTYKDKVGNFASTAGWTLGSKSGAKLFNSLSIISLTLDQEKEVKEIAQNVYRPCCGNSTIFPDCNHGAAMLGFIELAVSQGMPKDEIYKKALTLNSYWFPQNYVELATYYKTQKGTQWKDVNPIEVLGATYSSNQGYTEIDRQLEEKGLLPKAQGGSGCGV